MELKDTVKLMESADFKERFKAEYFQLKIRYEKLEAMLNKMLDGTLEFNPSCPYEVLNEQAVFMKNYLSILKLRADFEGIDLKEEE